MDLNYETIDKIIREALNEDIGDGDHTSLATIPKQTQGKAKLLAKEKGTLAGVALAERIFKTYDPDLIVEIFIVDGAIIQPGDIILHVSGSSRSILATERLVLNFMQRMSGIATQTQALVQKIAHTNCRLLDTRKTTPNLRYMEKWAVRIGGACNHRFALYDMIMIKDNHVDYAGGVKNAIEATHRYLTEKNKKLKIEIEVRNFEELNEVLEIGQIDRIMLDNFSPNNIKEALKMIPKHIETEASGGITDETIVGYAQTGVDFISVGALTHSFKSLDLSLKAM